MEDSIACSHYSSQRFLFKIDSRVRVIAANGRMSYTGLLNFNLVFLYNEIFSSSQNDFGNGFQPISAGHFSVTTQIISITLKRLS
jgi:hypothetical protein